MSDPAELLDRLDAAEDAFSHAAGCPEFEPEVNASTEAEPGEGPLQKACRLLTVAQKLDDGEYYSAVLESSFITIEQTLQAYLLTLTGVDQYELCDHDRPYELARG